MEREKEERAEEEREEKAMEEKEEKAMEEKEEREKRRKRRKGLRDQYCRGPKMEVPMRTMVAPWRMARGQSWDIPMESSVKSVSWG